MIMNNDIYIILVISVLWLMLILLSFYGLINFIKEKHTFIIIFFSFFLILFLVSPLILLYDNFIDYYNKRKLVPFGEFLPFEKFFNNFGLKKITEGHGSFLGGKINKNLIVDNFNILPLICYEIIFTELIQKSETASNLIVNISEDGWFGDTIGPNQHFAKSIFRAIENNTFLIRSANKGISAIIDNKGNIIKQLDRNEAGNIELEIPLIKSKKVKNDLIFFILLITYLFIFLINIKKNAR